MILKVILPRNLQRVLERPHWPGWLVSAWTDWLALTAKQGPHF